MSDLETRSRARLATLAENRSRFLADAQRQLAALDAAIAEITALLDPPPPPDTSENGVAHEVVATSVVAATANAGE